MPSHSRGRSILLAMPLITLLSDFGNATTNLLYDRIKSLRTKVVRIKGKSVGALKRTYHDVAPGKPLALIGSSGLLEVAVRDGAAAERLKIKVGDSVSLQ